MPAKPRFNFAQIIPEVGDVPIDIWLSGQGNYSLAIAHAHLFWPEFVEFDKCVFFAGFSLRTFDKLMFENKDDRSAVEAEMNHRHIIELFPLAVADVTTTQLRHLGNMLKEIWQAKLNRDFPNRKIEVHFEDIDLPEEDWQDYKITFWQPGNRPSG